MTGDSRPRATSGRRLFPLPTKLSSGRLLFFSAPMTAVCHISAKNLTFIGPYPPFGPFQPLWLRTMAEISLTKALGSPKIPDTIVAGGVLLTPTVTPVALIVDYGLSSCSGSNELCCGLSGASHWVSAIWW